MEKKKPSKSIIALIAAIVVVAVVIGFVAGRISKGGKGPGGEGETAITQQPGEESGKTAATTPGAGIAEGSTPTPEPGTTEGSMPTPELTAAVTPTPTPAVIKTESGTPYENHGRLKVKGTKLVDKNGDEYRLRGVSTHGIAWFPGYVNKDSFRTLRDSWGANCIRLAMYTAEYNGYCSGGNFASHYTKRNDMLYKYFGSSDISSDAAVK